MKHVMEWILASTFNYVAGVIIFAGLIVVLVAGFCALVS